MSRPLLMERQEYVPRLPVEEFIVPLLRERIEAALAALPPPSPNARVLDVGCGGQPFRPRLEHMGYQYVGVDAQDPRGIVDHILEIDREIPSELLARGPFDLVLCTEVLEHVAEWDPAFANLNRLLRPGGRLIITCPHFYILHEQPYDFWRPTLFALRLYARKHGFSELVMDQLGTSWDVLGTILGANYRSLRTVRNGLGARVTRVVLDAAFRVLARALRTRWIQQRFEWGREEYPIYLANLTVLQKDR